MVRPQKQRMVQIPLTERSPLANTMYDPVTCKCRAGEFVCWQASGATAEHCYVFLSMMKMKATGQTVTRLKIHSCHLQTIQLYAKCCVFFTLSPEALVLEYSRIPPWSPPITLTLSLLRCQMIHGRVVRLGHAGKACINPCLQTIACLSWILPCLLRSRFC